MAESYDSSDESSGSSSSGRRFALPDIRQRLQGLTVRKVLRAIVMTPVRLLKFILMLPVHLVKFLVKLPRRIWRAWKAAARWLYNARLKTAEYIREGIAYVQEARRLRRIYLPQSVFTQNLYARLHPGRFVHAGRRFLLRLVGARAWQATDELQAVYKALVWGRRYRRHLTRFRDIEAIRSITYASTETVEGEDDAPLIGVYARRSSITRRRGAFLHGLVRFTGTQRVLELGTGFGTGGLYMARGLLDNYPIRTCLLITIESNAQFAQIASDNVRQLGFDDFMEVIQGRIEDELNDALGRVEPVQIAFVDVPDADAMLHHLARIRQHSRTGSIIVLTGIRSTAQMARTWHAIQQMPRLAAIIDLWHWGILIVGQGPPRHRWTNL